MEKQQKHIPQLRFPEFQNDGEWEVKRLGDCLIQAPDYGLNSPAVPYSTNLPTYLRITDISDDGFFIKEGKTSVDTVLTNENSLQEGDIVFARTGASVGKVYKYRKEDGPLVFAGFLIRIKPDKTKLNSDFLFQFLFSNTYNRWVEVTSTRSGQPGINSADIASLQIPLPTLVEQQHIANVLSEIDTLLSATKDKLEQLKAYKKGLMQKLFPAHGKTLPEYRFKEFEKDGEWEVETLRKIITTISPTKKLQSSEYKIDGTYPIVDQSQNFICGYSNDVDALINTTSDDFIVFGDHTCSLKFIDFPFIQGADGIRVFHSTNPDKIDNRYLYQYLVFHPIVSIEYKRHFSELKEMIVIYPKQKTEQIKISFSLFSLDKMTNALIEKLALLTDYKKGLMQQMFPTSK